MPRISTGTPKNLENSLLTTSAQWPSIGQAIGFAFRLLMKIKNARAKPPKAAAIKNKFKNVSISHPPELNRQPMVYDTIALPIELGWHVKAQGRYRRSASPRPAGQAELRRQNQAEGENRTPDLFLTKKAFYH